MTLELRISLGIKDPESAPTVQDYVKEHNFGKVWVCPHLVSNGRISNPGYMGGIECTASTIPEEVKLKKVRKAFKQADYACIIWQNDEDYKWEDKDV